MLKHIVIIFLCLLKVSFENFKECFILVNRLRILQVQFSEDDSHPKYISLAVYTLLLRQQAQISLNYLKQGLSKFLEQFIFNFLLTYSQ